MICPQLRPLCSLLVLSVPLSAFAQNSVSIPNAGNDSFISVLQITEPSAPNECHSPCSILRTTANTDLIVFFLQYQVGHGLIRLSGDVCRKRTVAKVARSGETLRFPISDTATSFADWRETYDWQRIPERDTFYAVVVTDADVARRLANHIDGLPMRCTTSVLAGLSDGTLSEWLSEFAMMTARSASHIDWRAIELRVTLD